MAGVDARGLERLLAEFESGAMSPEQLTQFARKFPPEIAKVRRQLMRFPAARLRPVAVNGSVKRGAQQGWFRTALRDGTFGYLQRRMDDCFQAATATLLQVPPFRVPDGQITSRLAEGREPDEIGLMIDEAFDRWAAKNGVTFIAHVSPPTHAKRWIGVIETDDWMSDHTLVMSGRECLFDPSRLFPRGKDEPADGYDVDDITFGFTIEQR